MHINSSFQSVDFLTLNEGLQDCETELYVRATPWAEKPSLLWAMVKAYGSERAEVIKDSEGWTHASAINYGADVPVCVWHLK